MGLQGVLALLLFLSQQQIIPQLQQGRQQLQHLEATQF